MTERDYKLISGVFKVLGVSILFLGVLLLLSSFISNSCVDCCGLYNNKPCDNFLMIYTYLLLGFIISIIGLILLISSFLINEKEKGK